MFLQNQNRKFIFINNLSKKVFYFLFFLKNELVKHPYFYKMLNNYLLFFNIKTTFQPALENTPKEDLKFLAHLKFTSHLKYHFYKILFTSYLT